MAKRKDLDIPPGTRERVVVSRDKGEAKHPRFGERASSDTQLAIASRVWPVALDDLMSVPDDAAEVVAHAPGTFGSVRKALGWLHSPCGALAGAVPLRLLITGQKEKVEDELVRIEDGVYV